MTRPVYMCDECPDSLKVGSIFELTGDEAHHAVRVKRTRVGEEIDIVDGQGMRAHCRVDDVTKNSLRLRILDSSYEKPPATAFVLVQALAKGGRDEQAVETSTEFGVDRIIPWQSERCIVSWTGKEEKARSRWQATTRAAAKQSRRSFVPQVDTLHTTTQLASLLDEARGRGARIFICHEEAHARLSAVLAGESAPREVWFIVGPEGGITPDEVALLEEHGGEKILLTTNVLRSATAGAYAVSSSQALLESIREA